LPKTGFTIVELLVVIVVIGILASITIVSYNGISQKANLASIKSDLANASLTIKSYSSIRGTYPLTLDSSSCPTLPVVDSNFCLKSSSADGFFYSSIGSNFNISKIDSNNISYLITDTNNSTITHTNSLTPLSTPTVAAGSFTYGIVVSPDGKNVYATSQGQGKIYMYSVDANSGILTALGTPTISTDANPKGLSISPDGTSVYVANLTAATVSQYSRDPSTGLLSVSASAIAAGAGTMNIAVSPDGLSAYAVNQTANTISMYSRNPISGVLSIIGSQIATGAAPTGIAISPDGLSVYVTNQTPNTLSMYSRDISTGILSAIGSPLATGNSPYGVTVSPDGSVVYTVNYTGNNISMFNRNISTGLLTIASPASIGTGWSNYYAAIPKDSTTLYVTANTLRVYARTPNSANLLSIPAFSTNIDTALCIAASPDGNFIYVTNYLASGTISMYRRN